MRPLLCLWLLLSALAGAAEYYVAPQGSDTAAGTEAQPWRTLQKAADTLRPGDTAWLRSGNYARATITRSGLPAKPLAFRAFPGEQPTIDATGLTVPADEELAPLLYLKNVRSVLVEGLELRNYRTTDPARLPSGIFVQGACQDIEIRGCLIHDIENTGGDEESSGNAFGLAVYGTSTVPARNIRILGNELHSLKTGSSECLTINGNVVACEVSRNVVHDCNNIGIDFIGYEATCANPALDRARSSICRDNVVYNISSQNNQAYPSGDYSAGGIYCDGAYGILIEGNVVHHCDYGIELASEHPGRYTAGIIARGNFIYLNRQAGMGLGGYAPTGTGGTHACIIVGNTFYSNDTLDPEGGNGELLLRYRTLSCQVQRNIFAVGAGRLAISAPVPVAHTRTVRFLENWYYASPSVGSVLWRWNDTDFESLAAWQRVTRQDAAARVGDPLFLQTGEQPDLHLSPTSPARDSVRYARVLPREVDMDRQSRPRGPRLDFGADEVVPASAP